VFKNHRILNIRDIKKFKLAVLYINPSTTKSQFAGQFICNGAIHHDDTTTNQQNAYKHS